MELGVHLLRDWVLSPLWLCGREVAGLQVCAEGHVRTRPLVGADGHSPPPPPKPPTWDFTDCLWAEGCPDCITPDWLL